MKRRIDRAELRHAAAALLFLLISSLFPAADGSCAESRRIFKDGEIRGIVRDHIHKNMPWSADAVRISFPVRTGDVEVKGEQITWAVQGRKEEPFIGDAPFIIRFYDRDILARELQVRATIEVLMDVVVSSRPISRNAEIVSDDVRVVRKSFTRAPRDLFSDPGEVVGKTLGKPVGANTEITKGMARNLLLVRRGRLVKIILESGQLSMSTIGLSEEDGGRGDTVRVKNISSKKIVYARVLDPSIVKVDF